MMKPNEPSPNPYEIKNTNAFGQYTNVATTFTKGLENSIIELVSSNGKLLMSDVLDKFGNYPQVHKSVNKLLLSNRIIVNELEEKSYPMKKFEKQLITLSDPSLSEGILDFEDDAAIDDQLAQLEAEMDLGTTTSLPNVSGLPSTPTGVSGEKEEDTSDLEEELESLKKKMKED